MNPPIRCGILVAAALGFTPWSIGGGEAADDRRQTTRVTVVCPAPGRSPDEVERQVTIPLETALGGMTDVRRVVSASRTNEAVIWIEFEHGTDVYVARQAVVERAQATPWPDDVECQLAPVSSGDILLIALDNPTVAETSIDHDDRAFELREFADLTLRPRLLASSGVSQVTVVGGLREQIQIIPSPERLVAFDVTLGELAEALRRGEISGDSTALSNREFVVRSLGSAGDEDYIGKTIVKMTANQVPVRVEDLALVQTFRITALAEEGEGLDRHESLDARSRVLLAVGLQSDVDRAAVSERIDEVLAESQHTAPSGVAIRRQVGPRFDPLVRHMAGNLWSETPPDFPLLRRSTRQFGDVLTVEAGESFVVKLFGPELALLRDKADEILATLEEQPGVFNLQTNPPADQPTLQVQIDRDKAALFGVTAAQVAEAFRLSTEDYFVWKILQDKQTLDVVMKAPRPPDEAQRISDIRIRTESGEVIGLQQVARVVRTLAPGVIYREDNGRVMFISCDIRQRDQAQARSAIRQALAPVKESLEDLGGEYRLVLAP